MKITAISIDSFGKLKKFKIGLTKGINVIYGKNEQGKSTIMNFVRMMFYGASSGGNDIAKYPRKKYAPWDGSPMSGTIEFTHSGNEYRLEKVFSNSVKTDKTTLINISSGENISYSDNREIGRMFFGMGEEAFERSLFIGQAGTLIDNAGAGTGEIISKLQNLVSSGNENQSYTDINSRLMKAYEAYRSRSGRIGMIDKRKSQLAALEDQISMAKQTEKEKEAMLGEYQRYERELDLADSIAKSEKERSHLVEALNAIELKSIMKLKEEEAAIRAEHDELMKSVVSEGIEADLTFLDETSGILNELSKYGSLETELSKQSEESRAKLSELTAEKENSVSSEVLTEIRIIFDQIEQLEDEINDKRLQLSEMNISIERGRLNQEKQKRSGIRKNSSVVMLISAALILAGSVLAGVFADQIFFLGIIAAAIFGITAVILIFSGKKRPISSESSEESSSDNADPIKKMEENASCIEKEIRSRSEELLELKNSYANMLRKYDFPDIASIRKKTAELEILDDRLQYAAKDVKEKEIKLDEVIRKLKQTSDQIFIERKSFFGGCDIKGAYLRLDQLRTAVYNTKALKARLDSRSADIKNALAGRDIAEIESKLNAYGDPEAHKAGDGNSVREALAENETKLALLRREHSRLISDIVRLRTEMEQSFKDKPELSALDEEIHRVKAEIQYYSSRADAIELARDVLKESFEEMQRSFSPIVNEKTAEIFSMITCGKYADLSVSKEFSISVRESSVSKTVDWKFLSSGTADQLYFALRLAIAGFFSDKAGGLPLFLDDPFMQYDDERAAEASEFIKDHVKHKNDQILLFTCHQTTLGYFDPESIIYL